MNAELRINGERLWDSLMEIAKIGALPAGGCGRLALSDEDQIARDLFTEWATAAGCTVTFDQLGNMFARRSGRLPELPPIAIGSHLDTQPHGGKFDGVYGVLAGLEIVRSLNDHSIETDAPIEIVNWTNEEGARFAPAMLCSGVYAGQFDLEYALSRTDVDGVSFGDELARIGYVGQQACGDHKIGAFLEVHIEQGPVLENNDEVIGVGTGGQGQRWYDVTVTGRDAHSGSTPMPGRKDALVAAAPLISAVQGIALSFGPDAVGTVGALHVSPNSRNTIPGKVAFTIDFRHPDDSVLAEMDQTLRVILEDTSDVNVEAELIWHNPPIEFAPQCIDAIEASVRRLKYPYRRMVSGAGHDACQIARKVPTAMVFVPCKGGLSHNEAEWAEPAHLEAGCNVLLHAALSLSQNAIPLPGSEAGCAGKNNNPQSTIMEKTK